MILSVKEYNDCEKNPLKDLCNRSIQSFMPVTFSQLNYPTSVFEEAELIRYVDVMQETTAKLYYSEDFKYTQDEVLLFKRVCDKVEELTLNEFGKKIKPWLGLAAIPMFRIIEAIKKYFLRKDMSVFEIGPGSGYLGAFLISSGYPYTSMDNTQAFYLWQNRLYHYLAGEEFNDLVFDKPIIKTVNHIPWWKYCNLYKNNELRADVIICDHALCEIEKIGLKYILETSKKMLSDSEVQMFIYSSPGKRHISSVNELHNAFLSAGFVLINLHKGFIAYTPKNSELSRYEIKVKTLTNRSLFEKICYKINKIKNDIKGNVFYKNIEDDIIFYNPSKSPERYIAYDFMRLCWDESPYDYSFLSYLGYDIPKIGLSD